MDFSILKKLNIGGIDVVQLFINGVQVFKAGYKNWVKYSTEADGKTIYNGGLGYKNGYRVRSGGAEGTTTVGACSGYIPAKGGDVVGLGGYDVTVSLNENAINVYDANFNHLGQIVSNFKASGYGIFANGGTHTAYSWNSGTVKNGCFYWTVPPDLGVVYIRMNGYLGANPDGSKLIVTINEEIE